MAGFAFQSHCVPFSPTTPRTSFHFCSDFFANLKRTVPELRGHPSGVHVPGLYVVLQVLVNIHLAKLVLHLVGQLLTRGHQAQAREQRSACKSCDPCRGSTWTLRMIRESERARVILKETKSTLAEQSTPSCTLKQRAGVRDSQGEIKTATAETLLQQLSFKSRESAPEWAGSCSGQPRSTPAEISAHFPAAWSRAAACPATHKGERSRRTWKHRQRDEHGQSQGEQSGEREVGRSAHTHT